MAGNLAFLLRASEAPPAILGPSGAAKRLPGPEKPIFLKLAPLISELLLGRPWASRELPELPKCSLALPKAQNLGESRSA